MAIIRKIMKTKKLYILFCLLICILIAYLAVNKNNNKNNVDESKRQVITYSTDTPSEEEPVKFVWTGEESDPKKINIPAINVDAYIQQVGVDQNKLVAVPDNIYHTGWYVESVIPGQPGLSVIDGHVNGRNKDGIFINLNKLNKSDTFVIIFGNGEVKKFEVDEVITVKTEESAEILFSQKNGINKQLNLITCGGNFDNKTRQYDQRVIVVSKLIE